jgi:hypothetical protein
VSTIYPGLVDTYLTTKPGSAEGRKIHLQPDRVTSCATCWKPHHVVIDEFMLHPLTQEW